MVLFLISRSSPSAMAISIQYKKELPYQRQFPAVKNLGFLQENRGFVIV